MDNTQNIISFCTGYGGIELGIKRTGLPIRTVCYVEIEMFAVANLVAKIEQGKMDAAPIWTDLKTFDGKPFRNRVHGIIGGYPCQPFGTVGKRLGQADPRHLWPYIEEHIETIKPVWCFFENVRGHLTLGYADVYRSLRNLGYKVEQGIFSAAETGAVHLRDRLFILATDPNRIGDTKYVENCGIEVSRETEKSIGCVDWSTFELVSGEVAPAKWRTQSQTNPRPLLVRDDDGSGRGLDRLHLTGNGVVPQTAELAFKTLWNKNQ